MDDLSIRIYIAVVAFIIVAAFVCFLIAAGVNGRRAKDIYTLRHDMWAGLAEAYRKPPKSVEQNDTKDANK